MIRNALPLFLLLCLACAWGNPDSQRIRIAVLYEGTTEALSQGFNSPLQGVSFNMGTRLGR